MNQLNWNDIDQFCFAFELTDEMISDDEILLKGGYTIQSSMPVNWLPGICFAYEYMKLNCN